MRHVQRLTICTGRSGLSQFQVTPPEPEPDVMLGMLNGGNQQKALFSKWFEAKPRVLLLYEPSQGVDVEPGRRSSLRSVRRPCPSSR